MFSITYSNALIFDIKSNVSNVSKVAVSFSYFGIWVFSICIPDFRYLGFHIQAWGESSKNGQSFFEKIFRVGW